MKKAFSAKHISENLKVGLWIDFYACLPKDYKASVQQTLTETPQLKILKLKTLFYLMDSRLSCKTSLKPLELIDPIILLHML